MALNFKFYRCLVFIGVIIIIFLTAIVAGKTKKKTSSTTSRPLTRLRTTTAPPGQGSPASSSLSNSLNKNIPAITIAKPHEFPYQIALYYNTSYHCGASLVSLKYVLTAAHCVDKLDEEEFEIIAGAQDLNKRSGEELISKVSKIIIHPGWEAAGLKNDIALLELQDPVIASKIIKPVVVASAKLLATAGVALNSGWDINKTDEDGSINLEKLDVYMKNHSACVEQYKKANIAEISSTQICAGLIKSVGDVCIGDTGGPLVVKMGNDKILVGVSSLNTECKGTAYPAVYTEVAKFKKWIDGYVKAGNGTALAAAAVNSAIDRVPKAGRGVSSSKGKGLYTEG